MRIINRLQKKLKKRVLIKKSQINKKNSGISFPKKIFIRRYTKTKRKTWLRKRGIRRKNNFKKSNNSHRTLKKKNMFFLVNAIDIELKKKNIKNTVVFTILWLFF